jgi:UDP-N-acetyl-D-mannosaminuronic acid dehydrogenase
MGTKIALKPENWKVEKIAVVGAGIVGVPIAAALAGTKIHLGSESPARVVVVQRDSLTSGWKVAAINAGRSPVGGIEPGLDKLIAQSSVEGRLRASSDYTEVRDADAVLVCVQTDRSGYEPEYGPLKEAVAKIGQELQKRPREKIPVVIFESTLAPTTMTTVIKADFARFGLVDGRDILLGNSPNRVMSGHLLERIRSSDKIIGGFLPETRELISALYSKIVTQASLHMTNSLTAEVVKTLENAYRDVRIAYAAEIARFCDENNIDFHEVRREVNKRLDWDDQAAENWPIVPSGGLLVPTIGVGGHCLPKDGILLLWRRIESGCDMSGSLILEARRINDESPAFAVSRMEKLFGGVSGKPIALLGTAYRSDSEDTRNSPALALGCLLIQRGCQVSVHDPYVKPDDQNLAKSGLARFFTRDVEKALKAADILVFSTAHQIYREGWDQIRRWLPRPPKIFDGCNLFSRSSFPEKSLSYEGIGKGIFRPPAELVDFVHLGFLAMEKGFANETQELIDFFNAHYVRDDYERLHFEVIQKLAATCATGCYIVPPEHVAALPEYKGFYSRLAERAHRSSAGRKGRVQ